MIEQKLADIRVGPAGPDPDNHQQPILYSVASKLHYVMHLSQAQHLAIWRRIISRYEKAGLKLPWILENLCNEQFVDDLLENDVFWGFVGSSVSREYYGHATDHLSAVYAVAALLAASEDGLPLLPEDSALLE